MPNDKLPDGAEAYRQYQAAMSGGNGSTKWANLGDALDRGNLAPKPGPPHRWKNGRRGKKDKR